MEPEPFRNQRYEELKEQLIAKRKLFTDPEFPPVASSISFYEARARDVEWRRPQEMVADPIFFGYGDSADYVQQGELGNCWFVAACATLARNKSLLAKVIPDLRDQGWSRSEPERYEGIFRFRFWRFGRWIEVVVDDLLPTMKAHLIFARSKRKNDFWFPLLEKAYAKMHGCYENLTTGTIGEAFVDLTGGLLETIELDVQLRTNEKERSKLFTKLERAFEDSALLAAAITAETADQYERRLECGLYKGHIYAVTAVMRLPLNTDHVSSSNCMMIRLQNPWGTKEWKGAYSEGTHHQDQIGTIEKAEPIKNDGQFWMSWTDVCHYFSVISVCHQVNPRYNYVAMQGLWKAGPIPGHITDRAGGCINFKWTCLCNPQYRLDVTSEISEVLIMLQQRDIRERRFQGAVFLAIGIVLFQVESNRVHRLRQLKEVKAISEYTNSRSVFLRVNSLCSGRYVVVPTTYAPGQEGEFLLRLYSVGDLHVEELLSDFREHA